LRAFAKDALEPGASSPVRLDLVARDLSYWSVPRGEWVLEGGDFEIAVGASSRDLRLVTTVDIPAPRVTGPLGPESSVQEWLDDPDGRSRVLAALGTGPDGRPGGIAGNDEMLTVIGNFPLRTLLAFPGLGIDRDSFQAITGEAP
jgi:beta-glucosidase